MKGFPGCYIHTTKNSNKIETQFKLKKKIDAWADHFT